MCNNIMIMDQLSRVDRALLPQLQARPDGGPPLSRDTIGELRTLADRRFADKPVYGSTRLRRVTISTADADIDLFIFEPEQTTTPKPCLLWLHGGGYVMGSARDLWSGLLFAERVGCIVVSV
ncbi:MAG: carboxylesterase family protein, partial [Paracoccaceae bacterium]|nr:carboxylesterase family protein [Paracoccaceae bacterium]